jgi:hypothetical protein
MYLCVFDPNKGARLLVDQQQDVGVGGVYVDYLLPDGVHAKSSDAYVVRLPKQQQVIAAVFLQTHHPQSMASALALEEPLRSELVQAYARGALQMGLGTRVTTTGGSMQQAAHTAHRMLYDIQEILAGEKRIERLEDLVRKEEEELKEKEKGEVGKGLQVWVDNLNLVDFFKVVKGMLVSRNVLVYGLPVGDLSQAIVAIDEILKSRSAKMFAGVYGKLENIYPIVPVTHVLSVIEKCKSDGIILGTSNMLYWHSLPKDIDIAVDLTEGKIKVALDLRELLDLSAADNRFISKLKAKLDDCPELNAKSELLHKCIVEYIEELGMLAVLSGKPQRESINADLLREKSFDFAIAYFNFLMQCHSDCDDFKSFECDFSSINSLNHPGHSEQIEILGLTIPQIASLTTEAVRRISSSLPSSTKVASTAQSLGSTKAANVVSSAAKSGFGAAKSAVSFLWSSVDSMIHQPKQDLSGRKTPDSPNQHAEANQKHEQDK